MFSYERSELENIRRPYCEQSEQQSSPKIVIERSVIAKQCSE